MIICKQSSDINNYLSAQRKKIRSVGFVPTMGALHEGHISLIKQSKKKTGLTVCSIFVNPVQFNNAEDFEKYPSTIENDILLLEENGCDILFVPSEREMYPDESSKHKQYALGYLEEILEGKFRPGHFQGVCLVVEKLLNIVRPDILFLGQKDYQQCLVIKKLVRLMGSRVKVKIEPIIREKNGLAMSSRNLRLTPEERETAPGLHETLTAIKKQLRRANFRQLANVAVERLETAGFKVDYLELARAKDLRTVAGKEPHEELVLLIAAYLHRVRLIDNILIKHKN